ncbi:MAG: class IV adenylate cyclase [Thermoplasmata archaeon]|nr:MAG: class IV adenylate cyclase [Thermoplasmata archaeon]
MAIEIEAKAYTKNLKEIEQKIREIGAKQTWEGEQKDTYYNHPERDFAKTDEALRVREEDGKVILTYKGPKIDNLTKTREEIKVQVKDLSSILEILLKLGFKEVFKVKKHRKIFLLEDFKICLDSVENLGDFVEIETSVSSEVSEEKISEIRDSILRTMEEWGLLELERKSYLELLLAKTR